MTASTAGGQLLAGRVAIITGAASGIGAAMATSFAAQGARILAVDIAAERLSETVARIGGAARAAIADITDEAAVAALAHQAIEQWGRIDIVCNNAGIMDRLALAHDVTAAEWNRVFAVNVTGQFFVARAALPQMVAQKSGVIINTASVAGLHGARGGAAYTASKHAVVGLTKNLAWTYRADGIRVNAICPGPVETGIFGEAGLAAMDQAGLARLLPVGQLAASAMPAQHIADMALFLVSDAAAYVSGAIIPVDLGWTAA